MSEKRIPIHEVFRAFQGEGCHAGRDAFFIRSYGCPVHCPWCDSAGTWHPNHIPKQINKLTSMELARIAVKEGPQFVVLTGGEPAIHDWTDFSFLCSFQGSIPVHIETSGAFPLKGTFDWVTLSPKRWKEPIAETVKHANEFKFIIETPSDIKFYKEMIEDRLDSCLENLSPVVWLHPEWSHAEDSEVLNAISEAVKGSSVMRAGWQMHKLYKVDSLDPRSAPLVPLGGDASKGY